MKKCLILFLCLFTTNSLASGIASNSASAPCTNTTLETYSGNSNLSADWQPNEIQLRWYNGNTLLNVQSSANTCVYDGTLTIPQTAPTRVGYTFAGWQVRPEMDFSTISTSENGIGFWAKGVYNCYHVQNTGTAEECNTDSNYDELQQGEWKVNFSNGTLYGMTECSATRTTAIGQSGKPSIEAGGNCWCKATGWRMSGTNIISAPMHVMSWVFVYDNNNFGRCEEICAHDCGVFVGLYPTARTALFTPAN